MMNTMKEEKYYSMNMTQQIPECCPKFEPGIWHDTSLQWGHRHFIKGRVLTFMYMPLNFGGVIRGLDKKIRKAGATSPDNMCLSDHKGRFAMDIYLAVDREIPSAENVVISGAFYSRVYEGDFKKTGEWCNDFKVHAREKGYTIKKWYMWYTTCPTCAKKYGKNYVVVMAQIEP